ncbi:MAG: hypothetical protein RL563_2661 [Pseudomonadota bacterium]|jgi:hypothetical protein
MQVNRNYPASEPSVQSPEVPIMTVRVVPREEWHNSDYPLGPRNLFINHTPRAVDLGPPPLPPFVQITDLPQPRSCLRNSIMGAGVATIVGGFVGGIYAMTVINLPAIGIIAGGAIVGAVIIELGSRIQ